MKNPTNPAFGGGVVVVCVGYVEIRVCMFPSLVHACWMKPGDPGIDRGVVGYASKLPESEQAAEWSYECDRGGVYCAKHIPRQQRARPW